MILIDIADDTERLSEDDNDVFDNAAVIIL